MACSAIVVLASTCANGKEIWTLQLRYWRAIHGEVMTHRAFGRNAMSSRAVPVRKMLAQLWNDPAGPVFWGANQAGMQARAELSGFRLALAKAWWRYGSLHAIAYCWIGSKLGVHKQVANRPLEPYQYMNTIITSTEWDNFFELRCHPDAQPEFKELADAIKAAMEEHRAAGRVRYLELGQWHMPYVREQEKELSIQDRLKISTARCARVSYLTHDGKVTDMFRDFKLHDDLVGSSPRHSSPAEHQAMPANQYFHPSGNLKGWIQYRKLLEIGMRPEEVVPVAKVKAA